MRLTELNDEVIVLKELRHIDDLTNYFEFMLNESEMLDENWADDTLAWIKTKSDKVSGFFTGVVQTAALTTNDALAQRVADRIHKLTVDWKLKPIKLTLTTFIEKLNTYKTQYPVLNGIVETVEKCKSMLGSVSEFVASKTGFLKLIGVVAFSGLMRKIYEVIVKYTNFINSFVIDVAKDTVVSVANKLQSILGEFKIITLLKDKLSGAVESAVGTISGLNTVVNLFSGAVNIIAYITALVTDALEFIAQRDAVRPGNLSPTAPVAA